MDKRLKVLWLASWYPNKTDAFIGDFIQRHARAVSIYNDVYVINIAKYDKGIVEDTKITHNNLTEHILYLKKHIGFFKRIIYFFNWVALYKKIIKEYIDTYGKPDLVHVHVPYNAGLIALYIKIKYKIPYLLTEHWGIYNDEVSDSYKKKSFLFKLVTKIIIKKSVIFLPVSKFLGEAVNRIVLVKDYLVIPNVVDCNLFFFNEKQVPIFRFIHISNMVALKNVAGIINAAKILFIEDICFELILVGNANNDIRKMVNSFGLENCISFTGEIPYENVAVEIQQSNVLIIFSNIENSPCVIGEALCCGLPIIATDVGGIPELVNNNNGILVTAKNDLELSMAMKRIIEEYTTYDRSKIADDAKKLFSYPQIGKQINDIYKTVIK